MRQLTHQISVKTNGRRLYDITPEVCSWARGSGMTTGILTLYIQHTSASLLINENYDSDVLVDMEAFFVRLVPDGDPLFIHTVEGPDDMPAHVRTVLPAPLAHAVLGLSGAARALHGLSRVRRPSSRRNSPPAESSRAS